MLSLNTPPHYFALLSNIYVKRDGVFVRVDALIEPVRSTERGTKHNYVIPPELKVDIVGPFSNQLSANEKLWRAVNGLRKVRLEDHPNG